MVMDIRFNEVNFAYQANTPFETRALFDVNFNIPSGKYTAIIGHTGSGKSTILQHLNALLKPTSGTVTLGERVVDSETSNKDLKPLRQKVGIVFQFPESQLFEETVEKDIAFGPKNFGASEEEANQLAKETLAQEAGFILSFGKVDASYLYRDLVDAVREEQSFHMAASIFKEEKN